MTVRELKREYLQQLKIHYLDEILQKEENRGVSYGEMAAIDDIVTDAEIFEEYNHIYFVDEDFSSSDDEQEGANYEN